MEKERPNWAELAFGSRILRALVPAFGVIYGTTFVISLVDKASRRSQGMPTPRREKN